MKNFLLLALIITWGLTGCKKDRQKAVPEPAKGSISGVIRPVGAVTGITANLTINGQTITLSTTPDASGIFRLEGLTGGVYTLSFATTGGYAPISMSVTLSSGENSSLGNLTFSLAQGSISGTLSPAGLNTGMFISYTTAVGTFTSMLAGSINSSGAILADHVQAGTYIVSFNDVPGYVTPASQTVTVLNGQTTSLGTVTFMKAKTGSISCTVSPAGAVSSVTVSRLGYIFATPFPAQTYNATPDGSGHFSVTGLDAAYTYDITVNPVTASGLNAPNKIRVFLPSGQDIDLGNMVLTAALPTPMLSYMEDGKQINVPLVTAGFAGSRLEIEEPPSLAINIGIIKLVLNNVTGTGDYICTTGTGSKITFERKSSNNTFFWESNATGGDGIIRITSFDQAHQTVSGTFTGNLTGGTAIKKITNGVFTDVRYSKP